MIDGNKFGSIQVTNRISSEKVDRAVIAVAMPVFDKAGGIHEFITEIVSAQDDKESQIVAINDDPADKTFARRFRYGSESVS